MAQRAVFLDRDGTLIEERGYPVRCEDIVPLPGVAEALARLREAGWLCLVLTNQSAIARGLLDEEQLGVLHEHLQAQLAARGGGLDGVYWCPHHPEGKAVAYSFACECRKPREGLLALALADHDVDLRRSVFIGDSPRDLFPGAGPVTARILVRSGHPLADVSLADHVAERLPAAVEWLLAREAEATLRERGA